MKKFWKFILTIIITVAAYGYEAYDFGSEAHEAISLLQGQLEVKLLDVGHGDAILLRNQAVAILVDTGAKNFKFILSANSSFCPTLNIWRLKIPLRINFSTSLEISL